jgi:hypothetical protein
MLFSRAGLLSILGVALVITVLTIFTVSRNSIPQGKTYTHLEHNIQDRKDVGLPNIIPNIVPQTTQVTQPPAAGVTAVAAKDNAFVIVPIKAHADGTWANNLQFISKTPVVSSYDCIGRWAKNMMDGNRSCIFSNLILGPDSQWWYFYLATDAANPGHHSAENEILIGIDATIQGQHGDFGMPRDDYFQPKVIPVTQRYATPEETNELLSKNVEVLVKGGNLPLTVYNTPVWYQCRGVPYNIGHVIFDDFIPFISAMIEFGKTDEEINQFQMLYADFFFAQQKRWYDFTYQTYKGMTHPKPMLLDEHINEWRGKALLYRTFGGGLKARGGHVHNQDYSPYGRHISSAWRFRTHYLQNFGIKDNDWTKERPKPGEKLRMILLNKLDKRRIVNIDALVKDLQANFENEVDIQLVYWEHLKSHQKELEMLSSSHILFGIDGTGTNVMTFLPKGAVFISGSCAMNNHPAHLADFLFTSIDYFRVLYYTGYSKDETTCGDAACDIIVNPKKLAPLIREAIRLVREGYPIPVSLDDNTSGSGKRCRYLFTKYPEIFAAERKTRFHDICTEIAYDPERFWKEKVPNIPVPEELKTLKFQYNT